MKVQIKAKLTFCAIFLVVIDGLGIAHYSDGGKVAYTQRAKSEFRYVIFSNEVDDTGRPKDTWRKLKVLFDESAFSEENLKSLFHFLSNRFPDPDWLKIEIFTSLKQIPTPEEIDMGQISESNDEPELDKYHRAFLMRFQGNELLRYSPALPSRKLKTVILKGRDPFEPHK